MAIFNFAGRSERACAGKGVLVDSALSGFSASLESLAATGAAKVFHVPSPAGGRSAISFDGRRLLVPAIEADRGEEVTVIAPGGRLMTSMVVGFDPSAGFAVLELGETLSATAWTAASAMPALGSLALSIAHPSEDGPEVRLGLVRISHGSPSDEGAYIQVDGSAFPGFSGGALVGVDGTMVGVIAMDRGGNRGWALPALRSKAMVEAIVAKGFPSSAWLGISTMPVDLPENLAKAAGGTDSALLVVALERDGPASAAAILPGDILLSVEGRPVDSLESLRKAIGELAVGQVATLGMLRAGARIDIGTKAVERPDGWIREGREEGRRHAHVHHSHHGEKHHHEEGCGCGGEGCGCSTGR